MPRSAAGAKRAGAELRRLADGSLLTVITTIEATTKRLRLWLPPAGFPPVRTALLGARMGLLGTSLVLDGDGAGRRKLYWLVCRYVSDIFTRLQ
eukprot:scaffold3159_cov393-Prasinococcus_capsulatus_cf.AAC.29